MKSLKTIQTLSGIGKVLSRIAFIFSVIGFCGCIAGSLGLSLGGGNLIRIGGVTLHGLISEIPGYTAKSIRIALAEWLIVCAGEAVLAKFAELYFKNELKAGTPFTLAGAKELLRLGILTAAIPVGCTITGRIVGEILAGLMGSAMAENAAADLYFDSSASVALGVMFILGALLCRYGAELRESGGDES